MKRYLTNSKHQHIGAKRSVLWLSKNAKCASGWGSAPDAAGGAHNAPSDSLVGWGLFGTSVLQPSAFATRCSPLGFGGMAPKYFPPEPHLFDTVDRASGRVSGL